MGKIVKPIRYFGAKGNFYKEVLKYFPKAGTYEYMLEQYGLTPKIIANKIEKHINQYQYFGGKV